MKIPVLLLGAAVLFWGWQTDSLIFAIAIAVILEASRWLTLRWYLSAQHFRLVANLCLIMVVFLMIYLLVTAPSIYFIYNFVKLLPLVFVPIIAAQAYSVSQRVDLRTMFLMSNQTIEQEELSKFNLDLSYFYFFLCIFCASTTNLGNNFETFSFYGGMFILSALALWSLRSQRFSPKVWLGLMLVAGTVGFFGYLGLYQLHVMVENKIVNWYYNTYVLDSDALNKQTNIGEIGKLKQSNAILFRVASQEQLPYRLLLRESTYNKYKSSFWIASDSKFTPLKAEANDTSWKLGNSPADSVTQLTVFSKLRGGTGLLKLADGTFQIDRLPVSQLKQNQYGTVKIESKNSAIAYQLQFNRNLSFDSPPNENDLYISDSEKAAIAQILSKFQLQGQSDAETLQKVDHFFQKNFTYSLTLTSPENSLTPLSTFLLKTRSGHCEYFATATTLLLRSLGIPTRYAVGYSVHEFSQLENQYLVRDRHAHAWTLVYVDGKWQAFDTTPANWTSFEDAQISQLAIISDIWSFLKFKFSSLLQLLIANTYLKYGVIIGLVLILIVVRKLSPKKWVRRSYKNLIVRKSNGKEEFTPMMSDFNVIEKALQNLGFSRHPSEPLKTWIQRLEIDNKSELIGDLMPIVELHYRDRFDPEGINQVERAKLTSLIQSWLDRQKKAIANSEKIASSASHHAQM